MDCAGVALASVISQYISAVLVIVPLFCGIGDIKFSLKKLVLNRRIAIRVLKIGIPSGLQNAIFAFANTNIKNMALLKETTKKIITVKINNSTMKRIFMLAAVAVMTMSALSLNAQNKFKGIIKYTMTSSGEVAIDIPASQAESEAKVMGEKFVFGDMMQDGREVTNYVDFSQYIAMLGSQGVELET